MFHVDDASSFFIQISDVWISLKIKTHFSYMCTLFWLCFDFHLLAFILLSCRNFCYLLCCWRSEKFPWNEKGSSKEKKSFEWKMEENRKLLWFKSTINMIKTMSLFTQLLVSLLFSIYESLRNDENRGESERRLIFQLVSANLADVFALSSSIFQLNEPFIITHVAKLCSLLIRQAAEKWL